MDTLTCTVLYSTVPQYFIDPMQVRDAGQERCQLAVRVKTLPGELLSTDKKLNPQNL